jgi:hypothetical protein
LVEAISKIMDEVKFAPLRKMERVKATAAYKQEEAAAPRAAALTAVPGESSGSSRLISDLETTAWTTAERANPGISPHKISQNMVKAMCSAVRMLRRISIKRSSWAGASG